MVSNGSDVEGFSDQKDEISGMPKVPTLGTNLPSGTIYSHVGGNAASSSGTNLRSSFIAMGFLPSLVDKAINEKGEGDADLLLETLFAYTAHEKINSASSDSFDSLLDDKKNYSIAQDYGAVNCPEKALQMSNSASSDSLDSLFDDCRESETLPEAVDVHPKQEVDLLDDNDEDARSSLLGMKFSVDEVDFAIEKLGKGAPIYELVDFIFAAQIAKSEDANLPNHGHEEKNEPFTHASQICTRRFLVLDEDRHAHVTTLCDTIVLEVPVASSYTNCYNPLGRTHP